MIDDSLCQRKPYVMPAKAGIHLTCLDASFRWHDDFLHDDFLHDEENYCETK